METNVKNRAEKNSFWDAAWTSEDLTRRTEMLDRIIPHTAVEFSYALLGDIKGKKLLEVGCGSGLQTVEFCRKGAHVTAIDVSEESISATKELCRHQKIETVSIKNMSAEALKFSDASFDVVYISRMLMHTNKDKVFQESMRVLKKDGILVITEVLKHWIFAFPYRTFSPYRTTNPKYISLSDIRKLNAKHTEFYLFSTFFLFLFYTNFNKKIALTVFNAFAFVDAIVLKLFPFIRDFAWTTVAHVRK